MAVTANVGRDGAHFDLNNRYLAWRREIKEHGRFYCAETVPVLVVRPTCTQDALSPAPTATASRHRGAMMKTKNGERTARNCSHSRICTLRRQSR